MKRVDDLKPCCGDLPWKIASIVVATLFVWCLL
jgi:hypothetical protein